MDEILEAYKFTLIVLLAQLGKTFTAITRIVTEIKYDREYGKSIHILFTINTYLNNKQFANRLQMIENEKKGSVCIFASQYNGSLTHVTSLLELQGLCLNESTCPKVILACGNTKRYEDGMSFVKILENNPSCISRVFVYYDELHKYINDTLRAQIELLHSFEIVKGISTMTATPEKIWKLTGFWSKLRMIEIENYNDANYVGYKDIIFNCVDDFFENPYIRPKPFDFHTLDKQTIGFIEHVLDRFSDEIMKEGARIFMPAHIRRIGHTQVRDLVFKRCSHAVVITLNGIEKVLQYKDAYYGHVRTIPLVSENGEEVCELISNLMLKHHLEKRPMVITGYLCVNMGQTLTHKTLGSFTSAIIGHMDLSNDDIYQLIARVFGRMKDWEKYVPIQVYCPTMIMHRCSIMEECARNMALEHNGEIVTQEDYLEPIHRMQEGYSVMENKRKHIEKALKTKSEDNDKDHRVFDTQPEAMQFVKDALGEKLRTRTSEEAPKGLQVDGRNPSVEELMNRMWGIAGNEKEKGVKVRMVPTDQGKWCVYWRPSGFTK